MSPEQLRSQAQNRHLDALQQLIGGAIAPTQICDLRFRHNCLQISLTADPLPDPTRVVPPLTTLITQLQIPALTTLEIYGHQQGDELPHWREKHPLQSTNPTPAAPATPSDSPAMTAPAAHKQPDASSSAPVPTIAIDIIQRYATGERHFPGIDLSNTTLRAVNLTLADFSHTKWVWADLTEARLGRSTFTGANFRHANLSYANLQSAQLQGADFTGANLEGANLTWAELRGANFTDANLTNTTLHQANLERVTMPDGTYLD